VQLCLDTNRYVDADRGIAEAVDRLRTASKIFMPFIVVAELRAGFAGGSRKAENERRLARFLRSTRVTLLLADELTTHYYAELFVHLRQQGTPIPTNDIWIAALAMQHHLTLFARDAHFDQLPQILRI